MQNKLTPLQIAVLHAFLDQKLGRGILARIDYKNHSSFGIDRRIGVTATDRAGQKTFYSLKDIMAPIYRRMMTPESYERVCQ